MSTIVTYIFRLLLLLVRASSVIEADAPFSPAPVGFCDIIANPEFTPNDVVKLGTSLGLMKNSTVNGLFNGTAALIFDCQIVIFALFGPL